RLVEAAEIVIVRDEESLIFLQEWGASANILVSTDAVVQARLPALTRTEDLDAGAGDGTRHLAVHASGQPSPAEIETLRAVCQWLAANPDTKVIFSTDGVPRRRPITWPHQLAAQLGRPDSTRYYDGDMDALIAFLGGLDGIVTTKLHVGVVGNQLGVP